MKAVVLGAGLVGSVIARDLSADFETVVVDLNEDALERLKGFGVKGVKASATDMDALAPIVGDADIVCGAVPGKIGYKMLSTVIKLGKRVCDISFMPEDFKELDVLARKHGAIVVSDMGVAPGMSNFLVGRAASILDEVDDVKIYVGGLPLNPQPPFNYKIVFSAEDVLEEYTRPVRYVKDGSIIETEALSGLEEVDFPGVGKLEAFYTDGLRSLVKTIRARNMSEKTLRYPGHANIMKAFREIGLLGEEYRSFTASLLFPVWKMNPDVGDRDLTLMVVEVTGKKDGDYVTYRWELLDRFDEVTGIHSMARTTGYPCAIMSRAIVDGKVDAVGVYAPEELASNDSIFNFLMKELAVRGVEFKEKVVVEKSYMEGLV